MSHSQWLDWCHGAASASIDQLLDRFALWYGTIATVSFAVFLASLALSVLYFRLPLERKSLMWPQYGWFAGLICASSLMSSLAWGSAQGFAGYAFINAANVTVSQYSGSRITDQNKYPGNSYIVTSFIFQGLSFCGFVVCNFVVMRRLHSLATGSDQNTPPLQKRLTFCALALTVLCIVGHFIACVVAAAFNDKIFVLYRDSEGHANPDSADTFFSDYEKAQRSHLYMETVALLSIAFLYGALLCLCRRRLQSVESTLLSLTAVSSPDSLTKSQAKYSSNSLNSDTAEAHAGRRRLSASETLDLGNRVIQIELIQRIKSRVFTVCAICMLSMSLRAAYCTWDVLTNRSASSEHHSCRACAPCNSVYSLQHYWLILMPQSRSAVIFFSEPLTYCVALWGMTMRRDFKILLNRRKQKQILKQDVTK